MKEKLKKTIKIIFVILVLFYIFNFIFIFPFFLPNKNENEYNINFNKYEKDFDEICKIVLNHQKEIEIFYNNDEIYRYQTPHVFVKDENGEYCLELEYRNNIKLTKKERNSFKNVDKCLKEVGTSLACIYIYKKYVEISTWESNFRIVYSKTGKKPFFYNAGNAREFRYKLYKINRNWYKAISIYDIPNV